jgi:hypothetical protein
MHHTSHGAALHVKILRTKNGRYQAMVTAAKCLQNLDPHEKDNKKPFAKTICDQPSPVSD